MSHEKERVSLTVANGREFDAFGTCTAGWRGYAFNTFS